MGDSNKDAITIWKSLKPIVDREIEQKTQGMVQRRKAKVTTAPSLATNTIGVTEPYTNEISIPFASNLIAAEVGDYVWIEFAYGASNAVATDFASMDEKDENVAGNLTVGGTVFAQKFNGALGIETANIPTNESYVVHMESSSAAYIFASGASENEQFIVSVNCTSRGSTRNQVFGTTSNTITNMTNALSITNTGSYVVKMLILRF